MCDFTHLMSGKFWMSDLNSRDLRGVYDVVAAYAGRHNVSIEQIEELFKRLVVLANEAGVASVAPSAVERPQSVIRAEILDSVVAAVAGGADHDCPKAEQPSGMAMEPAISLDNAVTDDKVHCLCCGKGFTMLKRHLGSVHGLTEAQYRNMFNLPADFPLVAPNYSKRKAEYAKSSGLGKYARETGADQAEELR